MLMNVPMVYGILPEIICIRIRNRMFSLPYERVADGIFIIANIVPSLIK